MSRFLVTKKSDGEDRELIVDSAIAETQTQSYGSTRADNSADATTCEGKCEAIAETTPKRRQTT
jgi:hypothetical protein